MREILTDMEPLEQRVKLSEFVDNQSLLQDAENILPRRYWSRQEDRRNLMVIYSGVVVQDDTELYVSKDALAVLQVMTEDPEHRYTSQDIHSAMVEYPRYWQLAPAHDEEDKAHHESHNEQAIKRIGSALEKLTELGLVTNDRDVEFKLVPEKLKDLDVLGVRVDYSRN